MKLELTPINLDEANAFVTALHRHHSPVVGHKFSIGVCLAEKIVGVIIVGRPVSRVLQDGVTLEVTRCCTDGTKNACSMLYRAACRVAFNLGFKRLITYTLATESGASLRGAGFSLLGLRGGGNWNVPSRPRVDTAQLLQGQKQLWEVQL
jgi:hypothetical protein